MVKRVIIESPYAGEVDSNLTYLRSCMRDSLLRGEAPYASHGLYTQPGVLRDEDLDERELGLLAGFTWRSHADVTIFYIDRGISSGMNRAFMHCLQWGFPFELRSLFVPRPLASNTDSSHEEALRQAYETYRLRQYPLREHPKSQSPSKGA